MSEKSNVHVYLELIHFIIKNLLNKCKCKIIQNKFSYSVEIIDLLYKTIKCVHEIFDAANYKIRLLEIKM